MKFRLWLENELMNVRYLWDIKMSPRHVKGKVLRARDQISGQNLWIKPGTLAVLLDSGKDYVIVAVPSGLGFMPAKTEPQEWEETGEVFDGGSEELIKKTHDQTGVISLDRIEFYTKKLQNDNHVTGYYPLDNGTRAGVSIIYHEPPKGPIGYRSDYRLIVSNDSPPGMVSITLVHKGKTNSMNVDFNMFPTALKTVHEMMVSKNFQSE